MCGPLFPKTHQMVLSMFKNASNQKTDDTLKNQLFKIYNFVAWSKKIRQLQRSWDYSRLSNNRRVWNNRIGWSFLSRKINVWYGITVLGGKKLKIYKCIGWNNTLGCKFCTYFCVEILYLWGKVELMIKKEYDYLQIW